MSSHFLLHLRSDGIKTNPGGPNPTLRRVSAALWLFPARPDVLLATDVVPLSLNADESQAYLSARFTLKSG